MAGSICGSAVAPTRGCYLPGTLFVAVPAWAGLGKLEPSPVLLDRQPESRYPQVTTNTSVTNVRMRVDFTSVLPSCGDLPSDGLTPRSSNTGQYFSAATLRPMDQ